MIAPPYAPVGTEASGPRERLVAGLTDFLVDAGHEVTLLAAPGSRSTAAVLPLAPECPFALEVDHVARAFDLIDGAADRGRPFDIVHDHCPFAALATADRLSTPLVHTIHEEIDEAVGRFYLAHGTKAVRLIVPSRAQVEQAAISVNAVVVAPERPADHLPVYERAITRAAVGSRNGRHRRFRAPRPLAGPVH